LRRQLRIDEPESGDDVADSTGRIG
jgi:hypothetical protein